MIKNMIFVILFGFLTAGAVYSQETGTDRETERADIFFREGLKSYYKKDYRNAAQNLQKAIASDPGNAKAYYFLGYTYYEQGKMKEALDYFNQAYNKNPEYSPK